MKKELFIFIFGIVFLSSFVLAANCPPVGPPKIYSGNILVDEALLEGTYNIYAMIGDDRVGESEFSEGEYSIQVSPCSGVSGEIIFSVNGIEANEKGYYYGTQDEWGEKIPLDLTLNETPTEEGLCRNGELDPGEECDGALLAPCGSGYEGTISCDRNSCLIDYSNCSLIQEDEEENSNNNNNGNSGGGGGGGGSSSSSSSSSSSNTVTLSDNSGSNGIVDETTESKNETNVEIENRKGITGAVVGFAKTNTGKGIFAVLLVVVIIGAFMFVSSRKKTKNLK